MSMSDIEKWNTILEQQLADAVRARDMFHQREQDACKEIARIAPIARESTMLKFDVCRLIAERDTLREQLDRLREEFAALVGCARDNGWEGVSEGLHAYAWNLFLDTRTGKADQRRRWAALWKQAAKRHK